MRCQIPRVFVTETSMLQAEYLDKYSFWKSILEIIGVN